MNIPFEPANPTNNGLSVSCPWILKKNKFIDTPIPTPQTLSGKQLKFDFVPNLQSGMYIPGTGFNQCINGNPVHITPKTNITFFDPNNYEVESVSNCYSSRHYNENGEPTNKYLMDKCYTN